MRFAVLATILFCLVPLTVFPDGDLDRLFDQAGADIVIPPAEATPPPAPLVRVSGATSFSVGLLVGQKEWGSDLLGSGLYTMNGSLSFDARPDPRIRAWAVIDTTSTGVSFATPSISEFFFDYTMAESVVFRVGKQSLAWGQGRLFNPANLVSDVSQGISFKAFTPFFGQSLTFVTVAKDAVNPLRPSWREFSYAAQLSGDLGPFGWGFAGRARPGLNLKWDDRRASGFVKTVVFGVDLFAETLWSSDSIHPLFGVYWERVGPDLKLQAETTEERGGMAVKATLGSVKPGFQWTHIYKDGSGSWVGGIEYPIDGLTTMTFGFPVTYGTPGGTAMSENADPEKRRWVAGIKLSLDASF